tara:strand:+ start:2180 stop:2857 length:678 start_codon:yes stop_codon:yes gene_type:complete
MHNLIIGETCLLSYQLRRLKITEGKNELFDNMLATIDGVYDLIDDNFCDILTDNYLDFINYLYYPDHGIWTAKWINRKYSIDKDNIFSWPVFAFFHYDAFSQDQKDSIIRKTARFKSKLEDNEDINLFYYYREGRNYNLDKIIEKCNNFKKFISDKYDKNFNFILITKNIGDKNILYKKIDDIYHFDFRSPHSWIGIDDNWDARCDNDLFDNFKIEYEKIICNID